MPSTPDSLVAGPALAKEMESRRPASAWTLSVITHVLLVVALGFTWQVVPRGAQVESDRSVGIVLVHEQEGEREYIDPHAEDQANDLSAASQLAQAMPSAREVPLDLSDALPGAASLSAQDLTESLLNATQLTGDGTRRRGGMGQGTSTEVFGITGVGTRFVYVFDRSGSMSDFRGRPLQMAKQELRSSLNDLGDVHQFQIIFYNEHPRIFQPQSGQPELIWANDRGKQSAHDFIETIKATGGTNHMEALKAALNWRPDVIFFLTDADQPVLTYEELRRVRSWNRGTTIHAIEFGAGPALVADNFLVRLATQNGGQHAYVDVRR